MITSVAHLRTRLSFDWGAPLALEAQFGEELDRGVAVFHDDADVVHALDRMGQSLGRVASVSK